MLKVVLALIFWGSFISALMIADLPMTNKLVIITITSGLAYLSVGIESRKIRHGANSVPNCPRPPRTSGK